MYHTRISKKVPANLKYSECGSKELFLEIIFSATLDVVLFISFAVFLGYVPLGPFCEQDLPQNTPQSAYLEFRDFGAIEGVLGRLLLSAGRASGHFQSWGPCRRMGGV